jgi:hypothetical protein
MTILYHLIMLSCLMLYPDILTEAEMKGNISVSQSGCYLTLTVG